MSTSVTSQSSCDIGTLRLADGPTPNQGRVEICVDQNWGTICGLKMNWRSPEANVACRSLGFECKALSLHFLYFRQLTLQMVFL